MLELADLAVLSGDVNALGCKQHSIQARLDFVIEVVIVFGLGIVVK